MKRIPIAEALLVVLGIIALLTLWFAWNEHRAAQRLQVSLQVDGSRAVLTTFLREIEDYGRKNPDLTPVLQKFGAPAAAAVQTIK